MVTLGSLSYQAGNGPGSPPNFIAMAFMGKVFKAARKVDLPDPEGPRSCHTGRFTQSCAKVPNVAQHQVLHGTWIPKFGTARHICSP
jgi:hypothetical protein